MHWAMCLGTPWPVFRFQRQTGRRRRCGVKAEDDVSDLEFKADGELMIALNAAYIQLLEFVHDRDLRLADRYVDAGQRAALQETLNKIVELCSAGGHLRP